MTTAHRRRWMLAIVAIMVVVGVVGFVVLREDPNDLPRLVVLRQEQQNGQSVVVFRFDAPKHATAVLTTMWTMNPSTGKHRNAVYEQTPQGTTVVFRRASVVAAAGQSTLFHVLPPPDDVWRLLCEVMVEEKGISTVLVRVKGCWQLKSLTPLGEKNVDFWSTGGFIGSDLITNAVPKTADPPGK